MHGGGIIQLPAVHHEANGCCFSLEPVEPSHVVSLFVERDTNNKRRTAWLVVLLRGAGHESQWPHDEPSSYLAAKEIAAAADWTLIESDALSSWKFQ